MKISKTELYKCISELKLAELKHLEGGETNAMDAFEAIEMLEALENGALEVVDNA